jgi:uncharacterized protein (DUF58 family)
MSRGAGIAALGVCLCLLAGAFGTAALYVPGVALVLAVAGAHASVRLSAWRTALVREPREARVEEGMSVPIETRIRGTDRRMRIAVTPARRGVCEVEPATLGFRDPFGIAQRTVRSQSTRLLVLPRIERSTHAGLARVLALAGAPRPAGGAGDVDGVQPARPGVAAARIHWPTVARTGTLVERRLHAERDGDPLVVLDARRAASRDALDMAVRAAGSLAVALARAGGCRVLLAGERCAHRLDPQLTAWPELHERLALLDGARALAWPVIERAPFVVWVSASERAPTRPGEHALAGDLLVTPFARPGRATLATVAGCAVQRTDAGRRARVA